MPLLITDGVYYVHHPHHRNQNPNKSQWIISQIEERTVFHDAYNKHWIRGDEAWGLHAPGGVVGYVGVAQDRVTHLIIAKFVADNGQNEWHGYPADHRNAADAPDEEVMKVWIENEVLPAPKLSKIYGGKKCKL